LSHHYRDEWHYSEDGLRAAAETADRWRRRIEQADGAAGLADQAITHEFRSMLEDDLATPRALEVLEGASGPTTRRLAAVLGLFQRAAGPTR
jgi:cysteinyl-tRNA synthetase